MSTARQNALAVGIILLVYGLWFCYNDDETRNMISRHRGLSGCRDGGPPYHVVKLNASSTAWMFLFMRHNEDALRSGYNVIVLCAQDCGGALGAFQAAMRDPFVVGPTEVVQVGCDDVILSIPSPPTQGPRQPPPPPPPRPLPPGVSRKEMNAHLRRFPDA